MRCKRCGDKMLNVSHYEKDKSYTYHMCKRCKQPTHQKRICYEDSFSDKFSYNKN